MPESVDPRRAGTPPAIDDPAGQAPSTRWPAWSAPATLAAWWGLIFLLTHIPIPSTGGPSPVPDKLIHFIMYGGLGVLLPAWKGWDRPIHWREVGGLLLVIIVYAVVDELLQIPVGRTAEWLDGVADLLGGATGLAVAVWSRGIARS
ncbi:MAG: VanZ family protein [Planctomycetaceae bacterium]